MAPDKSPKPRFTRQQIELAAIVLGALASAFGIVQGIAQVIAWLGHG